MTELQLAWTLSLNTVYCACAGADAASLFNMAEGDVGGEGLTPGPEHLTASDCGLRHPPLHPGAHCCSRLQLWYKHAFIYTFNTTETENS